ncbi:MAG: dienelactone hydrolase family protein [Chlamydiales bacterium]|nr:dienelactone hydrolase family protein [Chlamydiales bacterium]
MAKTEDLTYSVEKQLFTGRLVSHENEKRPGILVVPTWMGLNDSIIEKTEAIAGLGYTAYAVDLFGLSREAKNTDEAFELVKPLIIDKQIIRKRLQIAAETLRGHPSVENSKIAAVGFCFGGMCALELAKSGYNIRGAVTFHASLDNRHNLPIKPVETAPNIPASLLLLHGYKDALAPENDLRDLEKEFDSRGADWQVYTYGQAMHAFTNPKVNKPELSLQYHEQTANRAWLAMRNFLTEIFSQDF